MYAEIMRVCFWKFENVFRAVKFMTPNTHTTGINIDNGTEIEHPFLLEYTGLTMENALNNLYTEILQFQNEFCRKYV